MLNSIEFREKNLDGRLTAAICKFLKHNLALKRIITTYSGFHLQSHPRTKLHGQSELGSKIILSILITKNSSMIDFRLLPKLTTFLSTCEMFCLSSFHSPFIPSLTLQIERVSSLQHQDLYVRETCDSSLLGTGNGEKQTLSLSCTLTEGGFVGAIKITVEGVEIRETLPGLLDEPEIKIL